MQKGKHNARIVEGTFALAIFSCSGAFPEASRFLKTIAIKLAAKRGEFYPVTINFVRMRIASDILRTCVNLFRGNRGSKWNIPIQELDYGLKDMEEIELI